MASGMNNISSELRRSELTDRELGSAYADTNELIINSELEFDDQTEYRQSALQFEDHKARKGFAQKPSEGLKIIVGTSVMFAVGVTVALIISIYLGPPMTNSHGAVVSGSDMCSEMGLSILQSGGSAVDAAITTVFCEGVVRPHVTGIGGGGCLIIRKHAEKLTQVVDFHEMIPATFAASTQVGGQVAVPGLVKGLMEAHRLAGGRLSWDMLLKPVIKLAREGFSVSQDLADSIKQLNTSGVKVSDRLLKMVYNNDGQPFTEGQIMTRPELAHLLENIAANGSMPLHDVRGQVGQDIVTTVTEAGGNMTLADMTAFVASTVSALKTTFYNLTVEVPSVSPGGALLLLALNIVQSLGFHSKSAAENITYHYIAESVIAALAQQYKWAEMDSMVSFNNITSELTSNQFAQKLRALISANTSQSPSHYGGQNYTINSDVTVSHVSVFGSNEDMVSVSTSLGSPFGSGLVTDSGVILNNQLALFDAVGSMKERRVPSLTVPVVVHTPGRPCGARFTLCSSPGHQVIAGMVQILTSVAVFGQGLNESISQARLYPRADSLQYDADFKQDIVAFLQNIGHVTEAVPNGFNTVDGVAKINETVYSVTDKYGISVGVSF